MELPAAYQQLINAIDQLPAIGPRAAARLAQHLLIEGQEPLLQALLRAKQELKLCTLCQSFSTHSICSCCEDMQRDQSALLIVASIEEQQLAEQKGWRGLYFVLHGLLSPMANRGPKKLGIPLLQQRLISADIRKICIALEASAEGKATSQFISYLPEMSGKDVECINWSEWLARKEQTP